MKECFGKQNQDRSMCWACDDSMKCLEKIYENVTGEKHDLTGNPFEYGTPNNPSPETFKGWIKR